MAIDFTHPVVGDNYATLLQYLIDNQSALARMLNETLTITGTIPTNTVRWNITNNRFEIYNGSTWGLLTSRLLMDIDTLDGQQGSFYQDASNLNAGTLPAARFVDASHGSRSGGSLHAAVNTTVNGFMSATDKVKLNSIESGATADQSASEIRTLLLTVDGAGSGIDADLLDGQQGTYYAPITSPNFGGTPLISGVKVETRNVGFRGVVTGQSKTGTTQYIINLTNFPILTVPFNESSQFSTSTGRFTAALGGYYLIGMVAHFGGLSTTANTELCTASIYVNGGLAWYGQDSSNLGGSATITLTYVIYLAVGNYVDYRVQCPILAETNWQLVRAEIYAHRFATP